MEHSHERNSQHHGRDELDVSGISNPDVDHEYSDVNVRVILMFGVGLLIAIAITYFIISGLFRFFETFEERSNNAQVPASRVAPSDKEIEQSVPMPYLQLAPYSRQHPLDDWTSFEKKENAILDKGVNSEGVPVGIPINQAKEMLVQKGLPTRTTENGQQPTDALMDMPAYSSSGRMTEKRDR